MSFNLSLESNQRAAPADISAFSINICENVSMRITASMNGGLTNGILGVVVPQSNFELERGYLRK